jgi:hypothetical protein
VSTGTLIASFLLRILPSSMACLALQYFTTLYHKRHDCRGGGGKFKKKCALFLPHPFAWNISHSNKNPTKYYQTRTVQTSPCKVPVFLVRFSKSPQISNFMKIRPLRTELFPCMSKVSSGYSPPMLRVKSQDSWCGICAGQNNTRTGISTSTSVIPVSRGGFTVKLMKLKVQGPSFEQTPSKSLEGALVMP